MTTQAAGDPTANVVAEAIRHVNEVVCNGILARQEWLRKMLIDPRRDYYAEAGYPKVGEADVWHLRDLWERESVAARVIEVLPKESWQVQPLVWETDDPDTATPFEEDVDALGQQLTGGESWHQDEAGSPVADYLLRADVLSGIGSYGIILFGLDDGLPLSMPVRGVEEENSVAVDPKERVDPERSRPYRFSTNALREELRQTGRRRQLKYLRVFPEHLAQITQVEGNQFSPRCGMPVTYQVTFNDPRELRGNVAAGLTTATQTVHWTRVQHVTDGYHQASSSEVCSPPRLLPVLNEVLGIQKLACGGPEMYWKGAFPGLKATTHPTLAPGDVKVNVDAVRDALEQYQNSLQRVLLGIGMDFATLAPSIADPSALLDKLIDLICIKIGCPKRVFVGSERGELASSQDDDAWNDRLKHRQQFYLTPKILVPFYDRLISYGVLRAPTVGRTSLTGNRRVVRHEEKLLILNARGRVIGERAKAGYSVEWPDLTSQSPKDKAGIALTNTQTLTAYVGGGGSALLTEMDFLTSPKFLGMSEEEAAAILENARGQLEEDGRGDAGAGAAPLLGMSAGVTAMIELFKLAQGGGLTEEQLKQQIMLFFGLDEARANALIADGLKEPQQPPPSFGGKQTTGGPNDGLHEGDAEEVARPAGEAGGGNGAPAEGGGAGREGQNGNPLANEAARKAFYRKVRDRLRQRIGN